MKKSRLITLFTTNMHKINADGIEMYSYYEKTSRWGAYLTTLVMATTGAMFLAWLGLEGYQYVHAFADNLSVWLNLN